VTRGDQGDSHSARQRRRRPSEAQTDRRQVARSSAWRGYAPLKFPTAFWFLKIASARMTIFSSRVFFNGLLLATVMLTPPVSGGEANAERVGRFVREHEARIRPRDEAANLAWWNAKVS